MKRRKRKRRFMRPWSVTTLPALMPSNIIFVHPSQFYDLQREYVGFEGDKVLVRDTIRVGQLGRVLY